MQENERTVVVGDPADLGSIKTRRNFLRALGLGGTVVLLPSVFAACGDAFDDRVADGIVGPGRTPSGGAGVVLNLSNDAGILNYAYALEQLEAAYYTAVVASAAFSTLSADEREVINDLREHEVIHREFLRAAITAAGATPIGDLSANFTTALASRQSILTTARTFEDLGVAAYNGAGQFISVAGAAFLTIAGKIVSVEARHAAAIRDILDTAGTAFGNVSDLVALGADNSRGLDGALVPSGVISAVGATGVVTTPISIGTQPTPL